MAKKRVVDTMDFINEVYGMTASYESSDYGYGARGRKAYSSEYTKPVNPYSLAESLAFIKADEYKQTAQTAVITALGEHARLLNNMRKKGYSNKEIRSFAESSGFGEVSLEEVKDTVVEGAKDAWKAFLALIDKLIEVIKQFIRGLFDKEKKLNSVIGKVKSARKRAADAGKADVSGDIKVAFINQNMANFIGVQWVREVNQNGRRTRETGMNIANGGRILSELTDLAGTMNNDSVRTLIMSGPASVQIIEGLARNLGVRLPSTVERIFNYDYDAVDGATAHERGSNNRRAGATPGWESINVDRYKSDWNTFIGLVKEIFKDIKGTRGNEKNTVKRRSDTNDIEGLGVSISSIPKGPEGIRELTERLEQTELTLNVLKQSKFNKNLEKKITSLGNLKRDIIKNKDSKYSNKIAQLGRITIGKITQVLTYVISIVNMFYSAIFKVAAVNTKSVIAVTEKDSSQRQDFDRRSR